MARISDSELERLKSEAGKPGKGLKVLGQISWIWRIGLNILESPF